MSAPACYIIDAADMHALIDAFAWLSLALPLTWILVTADWWRVADRVRLHRRRRRLCAIRNARLLTTVKECCTGYAVSQSCLRCPEFAWMAGKRVRPVLPGRRVPWVFIAGMWCLFTLSLVTIWQWIGGVS